MLQKDTSIISAMFDRIAPSYDFLNRLLSFRRDVAWRKAMSRHIPPGKESLTLLDVATGTGDVILQLMSDHPRIHQAIGIDISEGMLQKARQKLAASPFAKHCSFHIEDASKLPFPANSFDIITIAFGIRNIKDPTEALLEMRRVLRPDGRLIVLEFSLPKTQWLKQAYLFYFRHVLPRIAGFFSRDTQAYQYLNRSVEDFVHGDAFLDLLLEAGFRRLRTQSLSLGIAQIYYADK